VTLRHQLFLKELATACRYSLTSFFETDILLKMPGMSLFQFMAEKDYVVITSR